ncbi:hypothetical protein ACHAXS_010917 [Conticribra weissflogii]
MSRRSSARLAKKRSLDDLLVSPPTTITNTSSDAITASSSSSIANPNAIHRPKPGQSPTQNDCGILPGE